MEPGGTRFRHEALFYEGEDGFVERTSGFVREGLEAGERVLVAVAEERAAPLRAELRSDAADVEFLAPAGLGRNPARIIPAWRDWVERNTARGTAFRGVGEPVRAPGSALEIRACETHEHLLNTAFDTGPAWWLLCPYDVAGLPEQVLAGASGSHRLIHGDHVPRDAANFDADAGLAAFHEPLPGLGPPLFEASFGLAELPGLRTAIEQRAGLLSLHGRSLADFVLVADELASNSVRHGGGRGTIKLWQREGHAVCEIADRGLIEDPLVGRRRPDLRLPEGGAGLWTANQLCDLVLIHSAADSGTAVRAYLASADRGRVVERQPAE
ncbi:MAG TPA: anti-sigma factor RsbA family regulatory protein [Actinospica sp.]|nr:anti-sigma factor RsbA family regulatory protein [Actinospica sp.]